VTDRIRCIAHQGKQILVVDLSHCRESVLEDTLRKLPDVVTAQPLFSVLILADFTGASLDAQSLQVLKETAVFDKPFVKKTAWIGGEDIPWEYLKTLRSYSLRDFPLFGSYDEALAWLVQD
jgi:hypothetical protein